MNVRAERRHIGGRSLMGQALVPLVVLALAVVISGCSRARRSGDALPPLSGEGVLTLSLADPAFHAPTWVTRVESCEISQQPDGSLLCDIAGSADESGGQYGGIRFGTGPLSQLQLDIAFLHPQQIGGLWVDLVDLASGKRTERWILRSLPAGPATLTFQVGQGEAPFAHEIDGRGSANAVDVFIKLRGANARAGFVVTQVRYRT